MLAVGELALAPRLLTAVSASSVVSSGPAQSSVESACLSYVRNCEFVLA